MHTHTQVVTVVCLHHIIIIHIATDACMLVSVYLAGFVLIWFTYQYHISIAPLAGAHTGAM